MNSKVFETSITSYWIKAPDTTAICLYILKRGCVANVKLVDIFAQKIIDKCAY